MSDIAIKVENLSKLYQLGSIGTGTLGNDLKRWWAQTRGKEDPFAKIGQINDRTKKTESEFVWALKDIDFEVKQGEVLGIIGRNGAGKSTLLKILSKITSPTTGNIKTNGRIASLLEVGTGFHPDLSGRDNIFMNGAILGMRKWEVEKKFDEIVDFSGVEAYIDTPVKRYSSGMYVRLAFAVAAFLEPEILIVDEVLAVGDSEFQKKCLRRMKDVSINEGRTILFVSHDLKAISNLCKKAALLDVGRIKMIDTTSLVLKHYYQLAKVDSEGLIQINQNKIVYNGILNSTELNNLNISSSVMVNISIKTLDYHSSNLYVDFGVYNEKSEMVIHTKTNFSDHPLSVDSYCNYTLKFYIEKPNLAPGSYKITIYIYDENIDKNVILWIDEIPTFTINSNNPYNEMTYFDDVKSIIIPNTNIELVNV